MLRHLLRRLLSRLFPEPPPRVCVLHNEPEFPVWSGDPLVFVGTVKAGEAWRALASADRRVS